MVCNVPGDWGLSVVVAGNGCCRLVFVGHGGRRLVTVGTGRRRRVKEGVVLDGEWWLALVGVVMRLLEMVVGDRRW